MGSRDQAPSLSLTTRDAIERHNRVLLHAAQTAHPVMYRNKKRFIKALLFDVSGSDIEVDVYLTGSTERIPPEEISLETIIT